MKLISVLFAIALVAAVTAAPSLEERIVGGEKVALGKYPYVVSLQKNGRHSCGGSILNENFVLTAAHCVVGYENNPAGMQIQYGIISLDDAENKVDVKKVHRKEDYQPGGGYYNDVAVLELSQRLKLGPNAQPVHLPSADSYPGDFANATLVGWGRTSTTDPVSTDLLKVDIILFTHQYCQERENYYNPEAHFCAGVPEGGHGQCNGDSGGPLTVNGVQYGIVSWSVKPCTSVGHPGVFSNVVSYRNWIKEKSGV